jgi:predicted phage tail protein
MAGPGVVRSTAGRLNFSSVPSSSPIDTETRETRRRAPTVKVTENKELEQAETHNRLTQAVEEVLKPIMQVFSKELGKLASIIKDQTKQYEELKKEFNTLKGEYADLKDSVADQVESLKADIPAAISTQQANTSCASVAHTALLNQPYNFLSTSNKTTTRANPLYCTIDTSRVEEDRREET